MLLEESELSLFFCAVKCGESFLSFVWCATSKAATLGFFNNAALFYLFIETKKKRIQ